MKKSIFLFALLFLSFSTSLWADDDIVWMIKKEVHGNGILLNNEKYIWLSAVDHNIVRNAETGEFIKEFERKTLHNLKIFTFNGDMNYVHINDANNKLYYYEAEGFTIIDSLEKENKEAFGQLFKSKNNDILYEVNKEKVNVWDILNKKLIRTMFFSKYEEPNLYSHEVYADVDCNNEKIIVKHTKEFRPQANPNTWYDNQYIAFYDALTLDSLNAINITGGGFYLSSTCKYFARMQGKIELYDYNTLKLLNSFDGLNNIYIHSLRFTNDDRYLITTESNKYIIQIWDLKLNKLIKTYTIPGKILSITNDNKFAYCGNGNDFFKLKLNLDPNSVEGEDSLEDIRSYPNPTNDKVNFEFKVDRPDIYSLKVVDLIGKEILTKFIGNLNTGLNKVELNKNNLPKGRYSVLIYSSSNSFKYNIIIGE